MPPEHAPPEHDTADLATTAAVGTPVADPATVGTALDLTKLLTEWNVLLMVGVWVLIQSARKALPGQLGPRGKWARLLPVLPVVLCVAATWVPGPWLSPEVLPAQRVLLGIVLGALTANLHNIASRLGLQAWLGLEVDEGKKRPSSQA